MERRSLFAALALASGLALALSTTRRAAADDDDSTNVSPGDSADASTATDASTDARPECARGTYRVDPAGHCCAPGQRFRNGACTGTVTSCAPGDVLAPGTTTPRCTPRACESGRVGAHCCWPGQQWSDDVGGCRGADTHCPEGTSPIENHDCAPPAGVSVPPATNSHPPAGTVFVPGGTFRMGSRETVPPRWVTLGAFYLDRTEVSHAAYARCVSAGACVAASDPFEMARRAPATPVVNVTYAMAETYCAFMGGRLPTEAEWEFAARGADGRTFPWGERTPDCTLARFQGCGAATVAVGSLPNGASPFGALDMVGNVAEWTADHFGTLAAGSQRDPENREPGHARVVRGGAFDATGAALRSVSRVARDGDQARYDLGFRCARTAP